MNRSRVATDHEEIEQWAEARGGKPTAVKGTSRAKGDVGMIGIDFPGYSGEGKLTPISWDEWFEKFDESNLAMILQDETAKGQKSHFNKLVVRESVEPEGGKGAKVDKTKSRRARWRARAGGMAAKPKPRSTRSSARATARSKASASKRASQVTRRPG